MRDNSVAVDQFLTWLPQDCIIQHGGRQIETTKPEQIEIILNFDKRLEKVELFLISDVFYYSQPSLVGTKIRLIKYEAAQVGERGTVLGANNPGQTVNYR